jgi:hypothetical protein
MGARIQGNIPVFMFRLMPGTIARLTIVGHKYDDVFRDTDEHRQTRLGLFLTPSVLIRVNPCPKKHATVFMKPCIKLFEQFRRRIELGRES